MNAVEVGDGAFYFRTVLNVKAIRLLKADRIRKKDSVRSARPLYQVIVPIDF